MLNAPSRPVQEHVGVYVTRVVRLLATFATVAMFASLSLRPGVHASSRAPLSRHASAIPLRPVSRRAHTRTTAKRSSHTAAKARPEEVSAPKAHGRRTARRVEAVSRRESTPVREHVSEPLRRRRGESRAAYRRRVARANREEARVRSSRELADERASAPAVEVRDTLVPPAAVAKGAQVSAVTPTVTPVMANTTAVQPTGSAREMAQEAVQPKALPLYNANGRLIVPPPLRGSREILVHQNQMADAAGLQRIQNDGELDQLRSSRQLVLLSSSASLLVNPDLPENRRCARPWTAQFAADIARAYYARFGQPLELNSAVRTISYQLRLQRVNGNAAAINGETASPHLTGQAIDFGKRGMSMAEIAWMRAYLLPLMQAGAIDVEEEFQQACFHISVYRSYGGGAAGGVDLAQAGSRGR